VVSFGKYVHNENQSNVKKLLLKIILYTCPCSVYPFELELITQLVHIVFSVTLPESKEVKDPRRVLVEIPSFGGSVFTWQ
jgi:hypothetical protein